MFDFFAFSHTCVWHFCRYCKIFRLKHRLHRAVVLFTAPVCTWLHFDAKLTNVNRIFMAQGTAFHCTIVYLNLY